MEVTDSGITMLVSELMSLKALSPIEVAVLGIIVLEVPLRI